MDSPQATPLFEHQFWLQIMGDHARFIFFSLAPSEADYIQEAQHFIGIFDTLLQMSHGALEGPELSEFNRQAYDNTYAFRKFKIQLLTQTLRSKVIIHLSPTFFNHMLSELEEYLLTINNMADGISPVFHPLHYNTLWLSDAVGHAAAVQATLDAVEKDFIGLAAEFEKQFTDLYIKTVELNGYTRTNLSAFPALDRLNQQAGTTMPRFVEFLGHILQLRLSGALLGTLLPLMADHMFREECYYLTKLSQTSEHVQLPDCNPAKPRVEE